MVVRPERLPDIMLLLGRLSPATYAASALRQGLLGPVTGQMWLDVGMLALFGVVTFAFVNRKMDWRQS